MNKQVSLTRANKKLRVGGKLSRRLKKAYLGNKLNKSKLKKLLKSVSFIKYKYPDSPTILPYEFCPECGCQQTRMTNYHVEYPEIWVEWFCARCGYQVAQADNSPYVHVLEELFCDKPYLERG